MKNKVFYTIKKWLSDGFLTMLLVCIIVGVYFGLNTFLNRKANIYFMNTESNNYPEQYFEMFREYLKAENNEVLDINISESGKIPEDCDTLVITTLANDISENEKNSIMEYIKNGGNILMLTDPKILTSIEFEISEFPNFAAILDEYAFDISDGIVMEENVDNTIVGMPYFTLTDVLPQNEVMPKIDEKLKMGVLYSGVLTFDEEKIGEKNITYDIISTTSDTAFLRTDFISTSLDKIESDVSLNKAITGAVVTKKLANKESKLVVFSNALFATNAQISLGFWTITPIDVYGNLDMLLNSVAYLINNKNDIYIRNDYDLEPFRVTKLQDSIVSAIIIIIPFAIIITGVVVGIVRRRKK